MIFSKKNYLLTSIFLSALIIRLIVVLQNGDIPDGDAYVYDGLALSLSSGNGYVNSNGVPHSLYPPFYPLFLSIIYTFFGHSYIAVKVVQSIVGAFSCVLIFLIGKKMHSTILGMLSAFISIFYFPFIKSAGILLSELLFAFFLLLIVFYLLKMQEDKRLRNCIILGLLLGGALLTRSIAMFLPFFILPLFIYSERRGSFRDLLTKYTVVLLFFGLSTVPWIIRNYNLYHGFIPSSIEGGMGFYLSYFPPEGVFGIVPRLDPVVVESNKIQDPVLRNKFLIKKTLDFIVNNPKKVLVLELEKILYLWAPFDWEIVGGRWFNFTYVTILPFFALGLFFALREFMKFYPVLLPIIYTQVMTLIFYGSPRFRLPIEPYMFIISVIAILKLWDLMRRRILNEGFIGKSY